MISKEKAIEQLLDAKYGYSLSDETIDMAIEAIEHYERWVPISKKKPKEFEIVHVCYKSPNGMSQAITERLTNMDGSTRWLGLCGLEPIAWKPLSPVYDVESEDEK